MRKWLGAEIKAMLEQHGVTVSEPKIGIDHSIQVWLSNPDGNAIELILPLPTSWTGARQAQ